MKYIFIDTNIFIYASGSAHPHKTPSIQFLLKVANNKISAIANTEILQEILYRYQKIKKSDIGFLIFDKIITIIPVILPIVKNDVILAKRLLQKYSSIKPRDAIHAAVMLNREIKIVCSYDKHFDRIKELKRITP